MASIKPDLELIHAASTDAGNRSMRKGERKVWSVEDYDVAVEEYDRLLARLVRSIEE